MIRSKSAIIAIFGIIILSLSLGTIIWIDSPLTNSQPVTFYDPAGDALIGTYYRGSNEIGVMFLEGFGSDQTAMKNMISEFAEMGVHMFTFDFSGHGGSSGGLTFDNAATDRLAKQVISAKNQFKSVSGLNDSQIILLGHSMGARAALQSATMDPNDVAGLILFGTQVNLDFNVQSSFFTGVNDADVEWIQNLAPDNPAVNILMISGAWDDVLPPSSAVLLYQKLANETVTGNHAQTTSSNHTKELFIIDNLVHNYEIYSGAAIAIAKNWSANMLDLELNASASYPTNKTVVRILFWLIALIGLFLTTVFGSFLVKSLLPNTTDLIPEVSITNRTRFLWIKILLWLVAFSVLIVLFSAFIGISFIASLGIPVLNLVYVGFIASYGILMLFLYLIGRLPGTQGKWRPDFRLTILDNFDRRSTVTAALIGGALVLISAIYAGTGLFFVFPLGRLFWLLLFTFFTTIGFYVGWYELRIITSSSSKKEIDVILNSLIGFAPFFLLILFYLSIGSLSGMINSIHGLIILALAMAGGMLIQRVGKNYLLAALFQGFLVQLLVLPQGVLFNF